MSSLLEIEAATRELSQEEQRHLLQFVLERLAERDPGVVKPRKFSHEQMAAWIAKDEAEMAELNRKLDEDIPR